MKIEHATTSTLGALWGRIEQELKQATHLEQATQALVTALHAEFDESVVLARTFLTVPFDALPASNQGFVRKLAESAGAQAELQAQTAVLSLIGTHGQESRWNDRRNSEGHVGIPLISSAFVEAIPMISRLLKELGVPLTWVDTRDTDIVEKLGTSTGLFFVANAGEAIDQEGRKIIAAQDFVAKYGVKSVFGIGGTYPGGYLLVTVLFCRDLFTRSDAERCAALVNSFKEATGGFLEQRKIFADA